MTATVEETRDDLPKMIRLVGAGEELVITDGGKPVARLMGMAETPKAGRNRKEWLSELRRLRQTMSGSATGKSSDEILAEDREERA